MVRLPSLGAGSARNGETWRHIRPAVALTLLILLTIVSAETRAQVSDNVGSLTRITKYLANNNTQMPDIMAEADWLQYIASYGDLIRAFGPDAAAGERHYQQHGRAEGRSLDKFDERQYLANYADLRAAYGSNLQAGIRHFIVFGYFEGRTDRALRPNIVLFLVDDLGYGEAGATSQADTVTPGIDAIATAGVVATSGYVTAPLCAPSRTGVLTGTVSATLRNLR